MAVGDIWEFTLRGQFLGQDILNVFGYEVTTDLGANVDGSDLAEWVWFTINDPLLTISNVGVVYSQMDAIQVTGGVGIGSYTIATGTGVSTGEPYPSSVCYAFRLNRASQASRHGYKRFAGVGEGQANGNTTTLTAGLIADVADALLADVTDNTATDVGTLTPRIISRIVNGQVRPTPLAFPIASVTYIGITTQTTRKP